MLLSIGTILFRILTLEMIEDSGDGMFYWQAAKKILYGIQYGGLNHWTTRFGVILPSMGVMSILGTHPVVYYVLPLLLSVVQVLLVYKVGEMVHSKEVGLLASVIVLFYPEMVRASSQLLPGIFSGTFIMLVIYLIFLFYRSTNKRLLFILLAVIFMFMGYITKISNLFFLPGIFIVILLFEDKYKYLIIFGGVLFSLFIVECICYEFAFGDFLSRVNVILGRTVKTTGSEPGVGELSPIPFYYLFYRWIRPGPHFILLLLLSFACSYTAFGNEKKRNIKMLAIPFLSFLFIITFAVQSIDPIIPVMTTQIRYWNVAIPIMAILSSIFLIDSVYTENNRKTLQVSFYSIIVILILVYGFIHVKNIYDHPIKMVNKVYSSVNHALQADMPILLDNRSACDYLKYTKIQNLLEKGKGLGKILESEGMSKKEYTSLGHDYARVRKGVRLFQSAFIDLEKLDKDVIRDYPDIIRYNRCNTGGKNVVSLSLKNKTISSCEKLISENDKAVYLLKRRPIDIRKIPFKSYSEEY